MAKLNWWPQIKYLSITHWVYSRAAFEYIAGIPFYYTSPEYFAVVFFFIITQNDLNYS